MRFPRHGLLAQALMMVHLLPELARADAEQTPPKREPRPAPTFGDPVCAADLEGHVEQIKVLQRQEADQERERHIASIDGGTVDLSGLHAAGAREVDIHDEAGRVLGRVSMGDEPTLSSYNLHVTRRVRTSINGPVVTCEQAQAAQHEAETKAWAATALREKQARRREAREDIKMRRRERRAGVVDHGPDEDGHHIFEPAEPAAKVRARERRAGRKARRGF